MAVVQVKTIYDDITGEAGAQTYQIGFLDADGNADWREIDLVEKNVDKYLNRLLTVLSASGRIVPADEVPLPKAAAKRKYTRKAGTAKRAKLDTKAVRRWAAANGIEVADRGRISDTIREQYEAATSESAVA